MRWIILFLAILLLLLVGCSPLQVICSEPYILVGLECCLDGNNNTICDTDEEPKLENPQEPKTPEKVVEKIVEKIVYKEYEAECQKMEFNVSVEHCRDDEITFRNFGDGVLHYMDVKLYDKKDALIDERRFRTQIKYGRRIYSYEEVDKAVKAVVTPTVEFDDEDIICPDRSFTLVCYGDED